MHMCAPYASYNWRVAFIWVYFYLFNEETRPDITRVTHSPREFNSWREKESVARPLTTREIMSSLIVPRLSAAYRVRVPAKAVRSPR